MKKNIPVLFLLLLLTITLLQSMEKPQYRFRSNHCSTCDKFEKLKNDYKDTTVIPETDIQAFKEKLHERRYGNWQESMPEGQDLEYCLESYNNVYIRHKNEANNHCFLDSILPVLLGNKDFSKIIKPWDGKGDYYSGDDYSELLLGAAPNPYLMNSLIYTYKVPIAHHAYKKSFFTYLINRLNTEGFVLNGQLHKKDKQVEYLKAILTPPPAFIQESKKQTLPALTTFMLCLHRLKNADKKAHYTSYNIPKCVFKNLILPKLVEDNVVQELKNQLRKQIEIMLYGVRYHEVNGSKQAYQYLEAPEKNVSDPQDPEAFLYHDFELWAAEHMNIGQLTCKALMKPKK